MTIFLGLTGSIGMGKSTTAQFFSEAGIPVHDSDATVHRLYRGEAVPLIEEAFPGTTLEGSVDRTALAKHVVGNEIAMKKLETIIHPLVRREERAFRKYQTDSKQPLAILDVPLLFETNGDQRVDGIIVVTAPAEIQRDRVLSRDGMTAEKFEAILNRQTPDSDKRSKADFIVDTSQGYEAAKSAVLEIINKVTSGNWSKANSNHA